MDSIFHEATVIANPLWKRLNEQKPMRVLSIRQDVIDVMAKFGFRKYDKIIAKGSYPGVIDDVVTIDYSDFFQIDDRLQSMAGSGFRPDAPPDQSKSQARNRRRTCW
ncbi:TRAP-type uncharacterized transport system substrate-binding protein [Bosea sp. BE125]|uniref:hypothetical protein n=1 Tax=Bosea sp. BE125 TaxID=2817909 RepID=UPI0028623457|nr:hypothetical protein [Bosea sp. BE125]MDR6874670.1 TRAP-type uncharacterized transport system substrate-binding protein [Bosea sp. BE125]